MSSHLRPEEIERESFRIIDAEAGSHGWSDREWPVVRRAIHTSADFEYVESMVFHGNPVEAGIAALRNGCGIVTDTTMALAGIGKPRLATFGIPAVCHVGDPEVARAAGELGITRSILALRRGASDPANGIFLIGNAPTALFELIRLIRCGELTPALVVAVPVGFVGAAESKAELQLLGDDFPHIPFITNRGRKGGSNVAAAIMNALLIMAIEGSEYA